MIWSASSCRWLGRIRHFFSVGLGEKEVIGRGVDDNIADMSSIPDQSLVLDFRQEMAVPFVGDFEESPEAGCREGMESLVQVGALGQTTTTKVRKIIRRISVGKDKNKDGSSLH